MRISTSLSIFVFCFCASAPASSQNKIQEYSLQASEIRSLYSDKGRELIWYFASKLEHGSPGEKWGVIQLFEEERLFELFPRIIDLLSDKSSIGAYSDIYIGTVADVAGNSLYRVASQVGATLERNNYDQVYWKSWYEEHKWLFSTD